MTTKTLSLKAAMALGALMTYLAPKIAQDAKVDLLPALEGVDAKNFGEKKEAIATGVAAAVEGKLAADASLEDLGNLLDAVGAHGKKEDGKDAYDDNTSGPDPSVSGTGEATGTKAACDFLKDKLSPEDYASVEKMLGGPKAAQDDSTPTLTANAGGEPGNPKAPGAMDESPEAKAAREKAEKDAADAAGAAKLAQDEAIKAAADKAAKDTEARLKGVREAEKAIRPYVGEIAMDGMETAADVYRAAFKVLEVDVAGVHESAFPALLKAQKPATSLAQDRAPEQAEPYEKRFPDAARIGA